MSVSLDPRENEDLEKIRRELIAHPLVTERLIDSAAATTIVTASLVARADGTLPVADLQQLLARVRHAVDASGLREHARVQLTGPPAIRAVTVSTLARDQLFFVSVAVTLATLAGLIIFRSPGIVAGMLAPALIGVFWTLGLLGLTGQPLNVISGAIAPLMLAITVTDSVHVLTAIETRLRAGHSRADAVRDAIRRLAAPCALTSVTTAVGFASLMIADIDLVRRFGVTTAAGVLLGFVAVMVISPRWALSRAAARLGTRDRHAPQAPPPALLSWIIARPGRVAAASACLLACMAVIAPRVHIDVRATTELPRGTEEHQAFTPVEERLGGMLATQVLVHWPETTAVTSPRLRTVIAEVHQAMRDAGITEEPLSLLTVDRAMRDRGADARAGARPGVGAGAGAGAGATGTSTGGESSAAMPDDRYDTIKKPPPDNKARPVSSIPPRCGLRLRTEVAAATRPRPEHAQHPRRRAHARPWRAPTGTRLRNAQ